MVGIAIMVLVLGILIYFGVDLYRVSQRKKEKEKLKAKPEVNTQDIRNSVSLGNTQTADALEDELVEMILELHPHILVGNRMTGPTDVTMNGRRPTQIDYEFIESLDMMQQATALQPLEAIAFKIKMPFDPEVIKNFELGNFKYIHPYQVTNMMPANLKVGMTVNSAESLDPITMLPIPKVITQEEYDKHNYVIFRCAFS
jgi:uncharacterized protein YneF (UPF0154 family)